MLTLEAMRLIALLLVACSGAPPSPEVDAGNGLCTPLEGRECSCAGGPGAQLCTAAGEWGPCRCLGADGGPEPDAGDLDGGLELDAGSDGGSDAGMDAGRIDAGSDAGRDAGLVDGGARDAGVDAWTPCGRPVCCTVVPQSGCMSGEACRYHREGTVSVPDCEPAGTAREREPCERYPGGGDSCRPGHFCSVICFRSCRTDADCPAYMGTPQRCDSGGFAGPYCVLVL